MFIFDFQFYGEFSKYQEKFKIWARCNCKSLSFRPATQEIGVVEWQSEDGLGKSMRTCLKNNLKSKRDGGGGCSPNVTELACLPSERP
jgi:hypothetical protein